MSRSIVKTPIFGRSFAASQKQDKIRAARSERVTSRTALAANVDSDALMITSRRAAHSNVNTFAKDGKKYHPVRVSHVGRALQILQLPEWLHTEREVHQALAK